MNLHYAKKIVIAVQNALDLDPCTVSEREFRAELHFFAKYFQSDRIRISTPSSSNFPTDDVTYASTTVLISPDNNGTNSSENEVLKITYFGGDGTPVGLHHGLTITRLPQSELLYQRDRGQDPTNQWDKNVLAEGNPGFEFTPYISDRSWMSREDFFDLMVDYGITKFLELNKPTPFLVETAILNLWNIENGGAPSEMGINVEFASKIEAKTESSKVTIIIISCDSRPDIEQIAFAYSIGEGPNQYALTAYIIDPSEEDPDNIEYVYVRESWQNEATEWCQNFMANDPLITDENGDVLFKGEPILIQEEYPCPVFQF